LQNRAIDRHNTLNIWILDFDSYLLSIKKPSPMHLGNGSGRDWLLLDPRENLPWAMAQCLSDGFLDL
jgi:hypothetical protein